MFRVHYWVSIYCIPYVHFWSQNWDFYHISVSHKNAKKERKSQSAWFSEFHSRLLSTYQFIGEINSTKVYLTFPSYMKATKTIYYFRSQPIDDVSHMGYSIVGDGCCDTSMSESSYHFVVSLTIQYNTIR